MPAVNVGRTNYLENVYFQSMVHAFTKVSDSFVLIYISENGYYLFYVHYIQTTLCTQIKVL